VAEGPLSALKPTTVRFVPDCAQSADELAMAAIHRYAYEMAAGFVTPGARVLDVGFGEGYGSTALLKAGAEYRGVEVDAEIVDHARERYGPHFETYDGMRIDAADGTFDLVLMFQVIAYFDDPQPLLREILRVLDPKGRVLVTTPNRVYRLYEGQRPWNRYHAREYSASEFASTLRGVFSEVTVHGIFASEPIDSIIRARADRARKLARLDPLGLRYRLPESLNTPVRRVLRRAAQPALDPAELRMEHVRHGKQSPETALDLLAMMRP
jgi:SAM-dependent methyltransferase